MKTKTKALRNKKLEKRSNYRTPADWLIDALVGEKNTSGVAVNEQTAMRAATVFACVRNIAEDIAKLPLILYRRMKPRGRDRATELPLYYILHDTPNDEMTAMDFRQAIMIDVLLGGNGYAEIVRNGGNDVVALNKISRQRVTPERNDARQLVYRVSNESGADSFLSQNEILHVRGIGDGLVGWSVIKLAKETIGLAIAAETSGAGFFGNSSLPTGVLETKEKISKEAMANLRESWNKIHGGAENRHKIAILEQGLSFKAMSISNEDAQFLESREFSVEDVCRWFRMPPHKVGHLKRATGWSTLEATNTDYLTDTLMPWMERWEQEIQRKLIPAKESELYCEHLVDALLRGDTAARSAFYREQFMIGAMSQNDIRESENRNPIGDEGDTYYVPLNMIPGNIAMEGPQPTQQTQQTPEAKPAKDNAETKALNRQRKLDLIRNAHHNMLYEKLAGQLKIEQAKVRQQRGKPNFTEWLEEFVSDTPLYVRGAIGGVIESFVSSVWSVVSDSEPKETLLKAVRHEMDAIGARHAQITLTEATDGGKVENWMTRAEPEADAELSNMMTLIMDFAGANDAK